MRTGSPPEEQFHKFQVRKRKADLLPTWFDQDAQHICEEVAMHPQTDSYIGYSMDFQDIEQEYKDKKVSTQMWAVAAHVYGREYSRRSSTCRSRA